MNTFFFGLRVSVGIFRDLKKKVSSKIHENKLLRFMYLLIYLIHCTITFWSVNLMIMIG